MPVLAQLGENMAGRVHRGDAILAGAVRFQELVEIHMVFSCPMIVCENDDVGELPFLMLIRRLEHNLVVGVLCVRVFLEVILNDWLNLKVSGYRRICVFEGHVVPLTPAWDKEPLLLFYADYGK